METRFCWINTFRSMKAIVQEMYGSPDDLELREVDIPVVGETIVGQQWIHGGAFAEYVSVREDLLALKPGNVTYEQAASVPTSGLIPHFIKPIVLSRFVKQLRGPGLPFPTKKEAMAVLPAEAI